MLQNIKNNNKNSICSFIGLGLIGGSIAKALRQAFPEIQLKAYDLNIKSLIKAKEDGIINEYFTELNDSFFDCEYLFLCATVSENDEIIIEVKNKIHSDTVLTDVGSVKQTTHHIIETLGLSDQFIGGHPMAGSEKTGYDSSNAQLLENAYYILTPCPQIHDEMIHKLSNMISGIGAIPLLLDYEKHDYITAAISHLPHIISASLVNLVRISDDSDGLMKMIAAGGFKDITRISSSSPDMWQSICMTNTDNILKLLSRYIEELNKIKDYLIDRASPELFDLFHNAKTYRDEFSNVGRGPIKNDYSIFVDIPDIPGSLAKTATLLADQDLSIKNIGIMHSREFQEGALRIEFYDETTTVLAATVLKNNNYTIYE